MANKRKTTRRKKDNSSFSSSSLWKPVSVELPSAVGAKSIRENKLSTEDAGVSSTHDAEDMDSSNHYDNANLSKKASKDLPVQPGEEVAMFYGLEVLDSSHYQVVGEGSMRKFRVLDENENQEKGQKSLGSKKEEHSGKPLDSKKSAKREREEILENDESEQEQPEPKASKKKKKKDKKDKKRKRDSSKKSNEEGETDEPEAPVSQELVEQVRISWSQESGGAVLAEPLCRALAKWNFITPTPIQAATLAASSLGRRNVVGAAPTGSGKTLAFLLPILQEIHFSYDASMDEADRARKNMVQALIVTPTRELATQIQAECNKLILPHQEPCVSLVGGIALVKQTRILQTRRPRIIVGTPGRLWAMISSGEHEHLRDWSKLQFLVLDEADRMTQEHCFPQLVQILNVIHEANPNTEDEDYNTESESEEEDEEDRLLGLPGIRGEARLQMLTPEVLEQIQRQRETTKGVRKEVADEGLFRDKRSDGIEDDSSEDELAFDEVLNVGENKSAVHRQTFIYSATLTLPYTSTKSNSHKKNRRRKDGLEGGIGEILEKCHVMGETKVVNLSSSTAGKTKAAREDTNNGRLGVKLPPGLRLEEIKCTQRHKDSHLYAYLVTTAQGSSGPCLVFCNSIAAVRRVGKTLQTLGLSVRILHAHMQQRARYKAVESLKNEENDRAVVVCTDVAARGLDIPSVSSVVHYDVARAVDTFVHRSGRTARGIGAGATGSSLSLVAPAEDKAQSKIQNALSATASFEKVLMDGRLMTQAQERVSLASKIVVASEMEQKISSQNNWFLEKAKQADLELDDDLMEDESNRSQKDQAQLNEANKAKHRLEQLLRTPMRTQRFGKFLSTNSAAMQAEIAPIKGSSKNSDRQKGKRRRR